MPDKAAWLLLILEHVDNLLPIPWINISESFNMKKEPVVCISRVGATKGRTMITWSVFLRHPCPRSPQQSLASQHVSLLVVQVLAPRKGHDTLVKRKLLAKIKVTRRVSVLQGSDRSLTRAAYLSVSGCCSSCTGTVLWKAAMQKMQTVCSG